MASPGESGARVDAAARRERWALLRQIEATLEIPLILLSAAWVALLVAELALGGLPPTLDAAVWAIWLVFIAHFVLEFVIAPRKRRYLRTNWLTAVALVVPAIRILRLAPAFRVLRAARVVRSVGMLRLVTSLNRGLGALRSTAQKRGVGYVVAATALVVVLGAAGMAWFESPASGAGPGAETRLADFGEALWWTAYTMTTGATLQPRTSEGRLLGWALSVYGLAVFGYLTAILASHFVGQDQPGARQRLRRRRGAGTRRPVAVARLSRPGRQAAGMRTPDGQERDRLPGAAGRHGIDVDPDTDVARAARD